MPEELFRSPQQGLIRRSFDRSAAGAVRALSACYTGFVLDRLGKHGFMTPAMKPLREGTKLCGLATTALGAELEVRRMAINLAQAGDVLVIVPIVCDGVLVHPGDVVLGDDDGVVVVPAAVALTLAKTIERELAAEETARKAMKAFKPYDVQGILAERGYRFED
jgi:regulator of RNase E activity RraA